LPGLPGGAFSPAPSLTYNSVAQRSSEFGFGWTSLFNQKITNIDSQTVTIIKGTGTVLRYTGKDAGGHYVPPGGAANALAQNADHPWPETQPNKFQLRSDTSGYLARLQSVAGGRWTLSRDTGHRITKIVDPIGGRTSYLYDASNNIRRIVDPASRITS